MRCINAAYVGMRCPSVYLSRSWIMSKRISVSKFFHHRVATQNDNSSFSIPNGVAIFRREPPNGGVEYRWGRQKNEILVDPYRALLDICILVLTDFRFRHTMLPSAYAKLVKENNEEVVVIDSEDTDIYVQAAYVSHKPQGNLLIKRKNQYISCSAMLSEDVA